MTERQMELALTELKLQVRDLQIHLDKIEDGIRWINRLVVGAVIMTGLGLIFVR